MTIEKPRRPEKEQVFVSLWKEAAQRLSRYGLGSARVVANPSLGKGSAGANGWTVRQVLAFLDDVERESIDGEAKYKPGAVWYQLTQCDPGSRISGMSPREDWLRAKRDRDLRIAAQRQAAEDAKLASERKAALEGNREPTEFELKLARRQAAKNKSIAMQEASQHVETGGGEGEPPPSEGV